jgi:hypothetical protein
VRYRNPSEKKEETHCSRGWGASRCAQGDGVGLPWWWFAFPIFGDITLSLSLTYLKITYLYERVGEAAHKTRSAQIHKAPGERRPGFLGSQGGERGCRTGLQHGFRIPEEE